MIRKKTIAVVEDEQALQKVLIEWLEGEGFDAVGITTGKEALQIIPSLKPDLILLDIILPELDGFEVMRELAKTEETSRIPIVILSNLGDEENRRTAMALGAKDYLVKAEFDLPAIQKVLTAVLKNEI